jgi:hypothetical protein
LIVASMAAFSSLVQAQARGVEVQAGLGYAKVFNGGGVSLAAVVERPLVSPTKPLQHALGLSFWYARTKIASTPDDSRGRNLVGLGLRYQLGLQSCCGSIQPFLAVPLQLLRSSIEDRATLVTVSANSHGVPQPPPDPPAEDRVGAAWGWGTGLELGVRLGIDENLSAHTSVQGLYQDIYADGTSNGAWNWHAGLRYQFGPS